MQDCGQETAQESWRYYPVVESEESNGPLILMEPLVDVCFICHCLIEEDVSRASVSTFKTLNSDLHGVNNQLPERYRVHLHGQEYGG